MHPEMVGVFIPIVAIVGGLTAGIIKMFIEASERRFEMRLKLQQSAAETQDEALKALREEVAALRETSTKFDLALEDNQQGLAHRIDRLEQRVAVPRQAPTPAPAAGEEPAVQVLGQAGKP